MQMYHVMSVMLGKKCVCQVMLTLSLSGNVHVCLVCCQPYQVHVK